MFYINNTDRPLEMEWKNEEYSSIISLILDIKSLQFTVTGQFYCGFDGEVCSKIKDNICDNFT